MSKSSMFVLFLFIVAIIFALVRVHYIGSPSEYTSILNTKVVMTAQVVSDPVTVRSTANIVGAETTFSVLPTELSGQTPYDQKIRIIAFHADSVEYGDRIYVVGKIKGAQDSPGLNETNILKSEGIYGEMIYPSELYVLERGTGNYIVHDSIRIKHGIISRFKSIFPIDDAGLVIALVLGDTSSMNAQDALAFTVTGTAHVIAVSGFKLTLVLVWLGVIGKRYGRKKFLCISILFSVLYLLMASFAPAVFRAWIMSGLFIIAEYTGRPYNPMRALLLIAIVMMTINPYIIQYDIGFLLSFIGILSIWIISPLFTNIAKQFPHGYGITEIVISSIAAQLGTWPIVAMYFHQVSFLTVPANALTVPLLAPGVFLGYFALLPFFGIIAKYLLIAICAYLFSMVYAIALIPYTYLFVTISPFVLCASYGVEILVLIALYTRLNIKKISGRLI